MNTTTSLRTALPAHLARRLRQSHQAEPVRECRDETNVLIAALCRAGWSLRELAEAMGVSHGTIANRRDAAARLPLPEVPARLRRQTSDLPAPQRPAYEIPADVALRIAELQQVARGYRGSTPVTDPAARASLELTHLMVQELTRGATISQIAAAAGVTRGAVCQRLGRFGHRDLPRSVAHTRIKRAVAA